VRLKITGGAATLFQYDLRQQRDGLLGRTRATASACLVQVNAGPQLAGFALAPSDLRAPIDALLNDLLIGEDARATAMHWQRMMSASATCEHAPLRSQSAAILDIALWDLKAKANSEPLWKALGGRRPRANAHLASCHPALSDEDRARWYATHCQEFGFRAAKVDVAASSAETLHRLATVRRTLQQCTAAPALMIDAGGSWSAKEAIRHVRGIERQFDLTWVEAPTPATDFLGLKRVSAAVRAAICAGAGLDPPHGYLPHFHHRSLDIVQIDTALCGITGALQLADAAFGFELPVVLAGSPGNFAAHLAGVLPYFMSMEVSCPQPPPGIGTDVRIEAGCAVAGDRPGHGLQLEAGAHVGVTSAAEPTGGSAP
jgi:L-alanine-DL-glutamate epimerase-like enolase superfamily enzyme